MRWLQDSGWRGLTVPVLIAGLPKMDTFTQKADPYLIVTVDQVSSLFSRSVDIS